MFALSLSVLLAAPPVPEWRVLLDQARGDTDLAAAVAEAAGPPAACMARALEEQPASGATDEALRAADARCGFSAATQALAERIGGRFPGTGVALAARAADAWMTDMMVAAGELVGDGGPVPRR